MKIKLSLSIIISIIIMQSAYSQSSKQDTFYRAIGIDATFINNFLPLDNQIGSRGNYLFHYFKFKKNNTFIKQALDIHLFGNFENNESDIDKDDTRIDLEYKIGKGKTKNMFKKVNIFYGAELSVDYFLNKRSNVDPNDPLEESLNTNLDQTLSFLFGPMLGVGYQITKRISVYTEAGFYLKLGYGIDNFKSEMRPDDNFKDRKTSFNTVYILPSSFILFYHF